MLNIHTHLAPPSNASELDTATLMQNLTRFPAGVLPVGVLRELRSRGDAIHDDLVSMIRQAIGQAADVDPDDIFYALVLLVPLATHDDQPLIESLLTLPKETIDFVLGDLVSEAFPTMIANTFRERSATEIIDWIDRLADHPGLRSYDSSALFRAMTLAVAGGQLERITAIDALVNRLQRRADKKVDIQSASMVCELMDLNARTLETVDAIVRASFERDQIDTDIVDIGSWDNIGAHNRSIVDKNGWRDPGAILSEWTWEYLSEDLDPVNATIQAITKGRSWNFNEKLSVPDSVDQLRESKRSQFPREAVKSLDRSFPQGYDAIIGLIREELARHHSDPNSWSGNGAYLGLVLTVANRMPLPTDLLETILRMPEGDRLQVFGDQFDLIVLAVAATPLHQHDFVEQWIWDVERSDSDRREMVGFYLHAYRYGLLGREVAKDALVAGLRRALQEEADLITPYAEHLAFLSPKEHAPLLDEAFSRDDVDWLLPLDDVRRMATDLAFAKEQLHAYGLRYRKIDNLIAGGLMFDRDLLQEKPRTWPASAPLAQSYQAPPESLVATTIRTDARTPRNAPCPCGSGKKFKKCCSK